MAQEIYVDGLGNISVQGPVVTLSFVRSTPQGGQEEGNKDKEVLQLTMTGQNLVKVTNILSNTLKRLAEKSREGSSGTQEKVGDAKEKVVGKSKKDPVVN